MICKWCGSTLKDTDAKCSRCGKEVPPLSVCGGFSDLLPREPAQKTPPVRSDAVQENRKNAAQPTGPVRSAGHTNTARPAGPVQPTGRKKPRRLLPILSVVLILCLIAALGILLGKSGRLSRENRGASLQADHGHGTDILPSPSDRDTYTVGNDTGRDLILHFDAGKTAFSHAEGPDF